MKKTLLILAVGVSLSAAPIQIAEVNQRAVCQIDGLYMASNGSCMLAGPTGIVSAMVSVNGDYLSSSPVMQYQEGTPIFSFAGGASGGSSVTLFNPFPPGPPTGPFVPLVAEAYAWTRFHFFTEGPVRAGSFQFITRSSGNARFEVASEGAPSFVLGTPFTVTFTLYSPTLFSGSSAFVGLSDFRLYEADGITPVPFYGSPVPEPSMLLPVAVVFCIAGIYKMKT